MIFSSVNRDFCPVSQWKLYSEVVLIVRGLQTLRIAVRWPRIYRHGVSNLKEAWPQGPAAVSSSPYHIWIAMRS